MKYFTKLLTLVLSLAAFSLDIAESSVRTDELLEETLGKKDLLREKPEKIWIVTATTYNPVPSQTNYDPTLTADMSRINLNKLKKGELKWIAVSRDLLRSGDLKYGDKVHLTCKQRPDLSGVYEIHDTMNKRWRMKIDILQDVSHKGGLFKEVIIKKIEES